MNIGKLSLIEMKNYLISLDIKVDEVLSIKPAGAGNMNETLRVTSKNSTFIVKQSYPYCQKYPSIPAPVERANIEAEFYKIICSNKETSKFFPKILASDSSHNVLILEDLGNLADFSNVYNQTKITPKEMKLLIKNLLTLHSSFESSDHILKNDNMKKLNHEYIFIQPLSNLDAPDLDSLTMGLNESSKFLKSMKKYVERVKKLGDIYLQDGKRLVHGDFYPNSWLKVDDKIFFIDPEFGFFGKAEFDIGVFLAHLVLSEQPKEIIKLLFKEYRPLFVFDFNLAMNFAGVELMRRLIGVAQLPINADLEKKINWLNLSKRLVLNPQESLFDFE